VTRNVTWLSPAACAGVAHHHHDGHHDAVISADHGLAGDLALPATLTAVFFVEQLDVARKSVKNLNHSTRGEQGQGPPSARNAPTWDEFKAGAGQVIQDAKQRMTELLSPGKTQGDRETADIRKLQEEQEKARADQAAQVAERRDQLAEKYDGSPDQEKYLKQFAGAAKSAAEALAR